MSKKAIKNIIIVVIAAVLLFVVFGNRGGRSESSLKMDDLPVAFQNDDVVFHALDDHTWVGNGHLVYNETLYLVEGEDRALLIDAGTRIEHLDEIVAGITDKPVTLALTHNHTDHVGAVRFFDEVWIGDRGGDQSFPGFKGTVNYMKDHQVFDLGGRSIEVFNAPGHTAESVIFIDEANHTAFSGDAFGSSNLLMTLDVSTFINTADGTLRMMEEKGIEKMYPGHFGGDNPETVERVRALRSIAADVLSGKVEGSRKFGGMAKGVILDRTVTSEGVTFNYSHKKVK